MKEQEIIEGNRLIADSPFAPESVKNEIAHYVDSGNGMGLDLVYRNLNFHASWDELMPIIKGVYNMSSAKIIEYYKSSNLDKNSYEKICLIKERLSEIVGHFNRKTAWSMCVEFIKWYNTQSLPIPQ